MEYCRTWNPAARDVFFAAKVACSTKSKFCIARLGYEMASKGIYVIYAHHCSLIRSYFQSVFPGKIASGVNQKNTQHKHIQTWNLKTYLIVQPQIQHIVFDVTNVNPTFGFHFEAICITVCDFVCSNLTLNPLPKHLVVGKLRKFLVNIISSGIRIGGKMPVVTMDVCSQWFIKEYFRNVPKLKIGPISFGIFNI